MIEVTLKKIEIKNFKNIGYYVHDFSKRDVIQGAFGSGKSNIFEAYKWALCCSNTSIEPIIDGKTIPNIDTEVTVTLDINNRESVCYRKSGRHNNNKIVNEYGFCGIPYSTEKSYKNVIASVMGVNIEILPLLLDIKNFTTKTTQWTWDKQRAILFDISGANHINEELLSDDKYKFIADIIAKTPNANEIEIKKLLEKQRRTIKADREGNNLVIHSLQEKLIKSIDTEKIIAEKNDCEKALFALNMETDEKVNRDQINLIDETIAKIKEAKIQKSILEANIGNNNEKLNIIQRNIVEEYDNRAAIVNSVYDDNEICFYCKQKLPIEMIDEHRSKFENEKNEKLALIDDTITKLTKALSELNNDTAEKTMKIATLETIICENSLEDLETKRKSIIDENIQKTTKQVKEREERKNNLSKRISELQDILNMAAINTSRLQEISKLQEQSKQLAEQEREILLQIDCVNEFSLKKVQLITDKVNSNFENIKFEFFSIAQNGNIKDDCELLYGGIPYSSCSTGQKIAASFYVNLGLQKLFNVSYPIWIDDLGCAKFFKTDRQSIGLLTNNKVQLDIEPISTN